MYSSEQLKLVSPEYAETVIELGVLLETLITQHVGDVEQYGASLRLPLQSDGMPSNTYYSITKTQPNPNSVGSGWNATPASLGHVTELGYSSGHITKYKTVEGKLVAEVEPYDNNESIDFIDPPEQRELTLHEIRGIIDDLSTAEPVHPDTGEAPDEQNPSRLGSFVHRILSRS